MSHYKMKLNHDPFFKIKNGTKTIEIRLNDEKRKALQIGDGIEFVLATDPGQSIQTEIIALHHFPTFKDLFVSFEPVKYGKQRSDEYIHMYEIYSKEDEEKYRVVGIEIAILR